MIPCVTNTENTSLYYTKLGYSDISNKTFALHATSDIGTTSESTDKEVCPTTVYTLTGIRI